MTENAFEYRSWTKTNWGKWNYCRSLFFPELAPEKVYVGSEVLVKTTIDDILIKDNQWFFYHFQISHDTLTETLSFDHQVMQWQTTIEKCHIEKFMEQMIGLFKTVDYGFLPMEGLSKKQTIPIVIQCLDEEDITYFHDLTRDTIRISFGEINSIYMDVYDDSFYALHYLNDEELAEHQEFAKKIRALLNKNRLRFCFT